MYIGKTFHKYNQQYFWKALIKSTLLDSTTAQSGLYPKKIVRYVCKNGPFIQLEENQKVHENVLKMKLSTVSSKTGLKKTHRV